MNPLVSKAASSAQQTKPEHWYTQFWPWFLLVLPAIVVLAGITTAIIAFHHSDDLVQDNYYKEGLAINQHIARDLIAANANLGAILSVHPDGNTNLKLTGELTSALKPEKIRLLWQHPHTEAKDFSFDLIRVDNANYRWSNKIIPAGRWYVEASSLALNPDYQWRLKAIINVTTDQNEHHYQLAPR